MGLIYQHICVFISAYNEWNKHTEHISNWEPGCVTQLNYNGGFLYSTNNR